MMDFPEYPKIDSIFKRDATGRFIINDFSCPEFEYLQNNAWAWTEKIDGTNIRIGYDGTTVSIGGRTANAQLPPELAAFLFERFTPEAMRKALPTQSAADPSIILYGEGFGRKIQKVGSRYIKDGVGFILFDARVSHWWLQPDVIRQIAHALGIMCVPILRCGTLQEAIDYVQTKPISRVAQDDSLEVEGLVLRPWVEMFARNGRRVITKVKVKDFA
jgi:hypothetical protein